MVVPNNGSMKRCSGKLVRLLVWSRESLSKENWSFDGMIFNMTRDYRTVALDLVSAPKFELPDFQRPQSP